MKTIYITIDPCAKEDDPVIRKIRAQYSKEKIFYDNDGKEATAKSLELRSAMRKHRSSDDLLVGGMVPWVDVMDPIEREQARRKVANSRQSKDQIIPQE
jgi:hypothetical protein